jgi:hypothetical protein
MRYCVASCIIIWDEKTRSIYSLGTGPPGRDADRMHLGPFGCLTKLSAKRDERVQKFVPQNCVIIFRNELTRLTPLGPKLMFWCILCYLGAFGTVWLPYKTR